MPPYIQKRGHAQGIGLLLNTTVYLMHLAILRILRDTNCNLLLLLRMSVQMFLLVVVGSCLGCWWSFVWLVFPRPHLVSRYSGHLLCWHVLWWHIGYWRHLHWRPRYDLDHSYWLVFPHHRLGFLTSGPSFYYHVRPRHVLYLHRVPFRLGDSPDLCMQLDDLIRSMRI